MRIVAEAVAAARFRPDFAPPVAFAYQRLRIGGMVHQHHGAIIIGALVGASAERGYELGVVARVALLTAAPIAGIARGMHAGLAAERKRAYAGVVRQRRQSGDLRHMARFCQRIFDESEMRLLRVGDAQPGLGQHLAAQRLEHGPDFAQLAGVAAGDDELFHERILPRLRGPQRAPSVVRRKGCHHAQRTAPAAPAGQAAKKSLNAAMIRSTSACETSRWSTMRMYGSTCASMPLRPSVFCSEGHFSASMSTKTMLVSGVVTLICTMSDNPRARRAAFSWSSASRAMLCSSAYRPAAASMPA